MNIYWNQRDIPSLQGFSAAKSSVLRRAVIRDVWKHWQVWVPAVTLWCLIGCILFVPEFPYRSVIVTIAAVLLPKLAFLPFNHYLDYHVRLYLSKFPQETFRQAPDPKREMGSASRVIAFGLFLAISGPAGIYGFHSEPVLMSLGVDRMIGICLVFIIAGVHFVIVGIERFKSVKSKISGPEYERLRFELAREAHIKEGPIGGMPKHLHSVEAYAAYRRRLKFLFLLMFLVFAVIGIAAAVGALA